MKLTKERKRLLDELVSLGAYKTRSEAIEKLVDLGLVLKFQNLLKLHDAQAARSSNAGEAPAADDDLFPPSGPDTLLSQPGSVMEPVLEEEPTPGELPVKLHGYS